MRLVSVIIVGACGGNAPPPIASGPPAPVIAPSAGKDDVIVATVATRPVWGSCVATQMRRGTRTRELALRECIDFELLAQAAESRGLATDREVIEATKTTLVNRLVDDFDASHSVATLRDKIKATYNSATPDALKRPETRDSWHLLVLVPKKSSADVDAKAHDYAEQIYHSFQNETGLFPADLEAVSKRPAASLDIKFEHVGPLRVDQPRFAPEYLGGLYAIPEVGRVSSVIKTEFGYHVILLSEVKPGETLDYDRAEPLLFAGMRRQLFAEYVTELMKSANIERHEIALEGLVP